jgi:hypothetical protein
VLPRRLPDGADLQHDVYGPTHRYVDFQAAWPWTRPGGDWIDANRLRHGSVPWFSVSVAGAGSTLVRSYAVDVTVAVNHCVTTRRWCAFLLTAVNAARTMAGKAHGQQPAPSIEVIYRSGERATLQCRVLGTNSASANAPITIAAQHSLPVFAEFDQPTAEVSSATLSFVITEHWSGNNARVDGYLLDPPLNVDPVATGVAAAAGPLDAGITAQPGVIGAQRYLDGSVLSDFVLPDPINHSAEVHFDPAIYGTGPTDRNKLPHRGAGKWILSSEDRANWSFVPSTYNGEGFAPLAPGMGALRIRMPAAPGVVDGSVVGSSGTLAANGMLYLPEPLFGRLGRIFVRYYFRLGGPYRMTKANRKHVYYSAGRPDWTTQAGKFGIGPDHSTSWGGVSATSGGPYGWQMRGAWYDCDAEMNGPSEGGWAVGHHLYDYYYQNPPGYNVGGRDGTPQQERWGQRGGLGGVLYAGHWYCVETEMKLNTISNSAPGFTPDGVLRTWIDGRLCYERTGMVFRSGPVATFPYQPNTLRPCRELGVRGLWLNWFHGGKTLATTDRTSFYSGLVWSNTYIGPMKMA